MGNDINIEWLLNKFCSIGLYFLNQVFILIFLIVSAVQLLSDKERMFVYYHDLNFLTAQLKTCGLEIIHTARTPSPSSARGTACCAGGHGPPRRLPRAPPSATGTCPSAGRSSPGSAWPGTPHDRACSIPHAHAPGPSLAP